ncbi:hypothetical protein K1719_002302 [Acacia pycnantha]|nr:hypothetical protein K1719_002302 [Acacia pycnantha]
MKGDAELLTLGSGGSSPIRNPPTAAEDARLASLISLDAISKEIKDMTGHSTLNAVSQKITLLVLSAWLSQLRKWMTVFKIYHMLTSLQQIWCLDLKLTWHNGMSSNLIQVLHLHL